MTTNTYRTDSRDADVTSCSRPILSVLRLLRRTVIGPEEQHLGHVRDVMVRSDERTYPLVIGVVALLGSCERFLPATALVCRYPNRVQLTDAAQLRRVIPGNEDLLLGSDVLGRRLINPVHRRPIRVHDLLLSRSRDGWVLSGVIGRNPIRRWLRPEQRSGLLDWTAVRNASGIRRQGVRREPHA